MNNYISIDVETTGLNPYSNRIVEIGAVAFDQAGQELSRFQSLVNPECPMPERVTQIHGLTDDDVRLAPLFSEVAPLFLSYLKSIDNPIIIAHNSSFDSNFITNELWRLASPPPYGDIEVFCSRDMAKRKCPGMRSYSLGDLVRMLSLPLHNFHRSIADCLHCRDLWLSMHVSDEEIPYASRHRILKKAQWPSHPYNLPSVGMGGLIPEV